MNKIESDDTVKESKFIDRRFFLKSSTSVIAAAAAITAIPAIIKEESTETPPSVSNDTELNTKHWKAGWMAF